jgi:teichuronic acid biosynthesis glycosyltransferase TuaG
MSRLVSVIMPAYNAEKHVAESIRSVQDQTYPHWELIVVDDGSLDQTPVIVQQLAAADNRINYLFQENGGQASARNTGIRHSRGELVAFLDADDLWLPEKLRKQMRALEESHADVISSSGFVFGDEDIEVNEDALQIVPGRTEGGEMFKLLYAYNRLTIQSAVVRRGMLERVNLLDESRAYQNCEDYDLWLSLAKAGAVFFCLDDRLIKYRRHRDASTFEDSRVLKPMIAVMKKHSNEPTLNERQVKMRIRNLYRQLLAALIRENKIEEARRSMKEFAAWDHSLTTKLQQLLLGWWPKQFNLLSRECLFRFEWHLNRILGRSNVG